MRRLLLFLVVAFAAGAAQAQIKCWDDAQGKRVCGDNPPPGAKVSTIKGTYPSSPPARAPGAPAAKSSAPLTPAERDQELRKRMLDEKQAAEKAEKERRDEAYKRENCERAKESLRFLESGQRVTRVDQSGQRYFLDDAQIAQEKQRARELVQQSCN